MFARTCVFSKQSLPTGLCGHHTLSGVNPYKWMAPLLPKLRGHFAEFLHHDSLDLLSILYLTTCVGLGYGPLKPRADAFLGSIGSPASPYGSASHLTQSRKILLNDGLHAYTGTTIARHRLPSCVTPVTTLTSPHRVRNAPIHQYPKAPVQDLLLSTCGSVFDGFSRVREYQPVVHRLRLSASP